MPSPLPLFPLQLVAYPGENLNLHIFEVRYRQLVGECIAEGKTFGIPTFLNGGIPGYGTEMEIAEVVTEYDDGRYDIRTRGKRVFQIVEFENPAPDKLYPHGLVQFIDLQEAAGMSVNTHILSLMEKMYDILQLEMPDFDPHSPIPFSYRIGHSVGLSSEGEYSLLTLETETERQEYIFNHLIQVIPVLENVERTKARIRMNGTFQEFGELDW